MTLAHPLGPDPANGTHDGGGRRHGEYKVPGGKLVVVDFDVVGRRTSRDVSAQRRLLPGTR